MEYPPPGGQAAMISDMESVCVCVCVFIPAGESDFENESMAEAHFFLLSIQTSWPRFKTLGK